MEDEEGRRGRMNVTTQPLKGEAMPLHWTPSDDFTSTVTPLDPGTPLRAPQTPPPLIAAAGSHWPPWAAVAEARREGDGRKEERGEMNGEMGLCKRSTVGQRILLGG